MKLYKVKTKADRSEFLDYSYTYIISENIAEASLLAYDKLEDIENIELISSDLILQDKIKTINP